MVAMLKLNVIVEKLKDRNLSEVSRQSHVSIATVWRVANGVGGDVKYSNVEKLSDYLEATA